MMNLFSFVLDNDFDDYNACYYVEAEDITDALMKARDNLDALEAKIRIAFPHWGGKLQIVSLTADGIRLLGEAEMEVYVERLRKSYVIDE